MQPRTVTFKFGPQNKYALTIPVEEAANAELVVDVADVVYAANIQEKQEDKTQQKQFAWATDGEE